MKNKHLIIILAVVILGSAIWFGRPDRAFVPRDSNGQPLVARHEDELVAPVEVRNYACANGKFTVRMEIRPEGGGRAEVFLPDNSKILVARTPTASGAQYANSGGTFVMRMEGDAAFIEEGGVMLYRNCLIVQ